MSAEEVLDKLLRELFDEGGRAEYEPTELGLLWELEKRGLVTIEGEEVELTDAGREHLGEEPAEEKEEEVEEPAEEEPPEVAVSGRLSLVPGRKRIQARAGGDRYSDDALDELMIGLAGRGGVAEFEPKEWGPLMDLQARGLVICEGDTVFITASGQQYAASRGAGARV